MSGFYISEQLAEIARRAEEPMRQAEQAAILLRDAQASIERLQVVHVRQLQSSLDSVGAACARMLAAELKPFADIFSIRLAIAMQPERQKAFAAQLRPVVESIAAMKASWASLAGQMPGVADLAPLAAVAKALAEVQTEAARTGTVTIPRNGGAARPERMITLNCGQALMLVILALAVLLYMDLPLHTRSRVEGLITVLGAAVWIGARIACNR